MGGWVLPKGPTFPGSVAFSDRSLPRGAEDAGGWKAGTRTGAFTLFSASQNAQMVLQMVLRMEKPPSPARNNLDHMQSMVSALEAPPACVVATASASLASRPQSQETIPEGEERPELGRAPAQPWGRARSQGSCPWISYSFHVS